MTILYAIGVGLVNTLFNAYLYVLLLRFFLQLLRADYHNPVTLWMIKLSKPLVWPLEKLLPPWRNISFAALLAVLIVAVVKVFAILGVSSWRLPASWEGVAYWVGGDLLIHICDIFFFAILIQAIFSWFRPQGNDWMSALLNRFTQPLLRPIRRIFPPLGGLDLSPIPILLALKLLSVYVGYPLIALGMMLA